MMKQQTYRWSRGEAGTAVGRETRAVEGWGGGGVGRKAAEFVISGVRPDG